MTLVRSCDFSFGSDGICITRTQNLLLRHIGMRVIVFNIKVTRNLRMRTISIITIFLWYHALLTQREILSIGNLRMRNKNNQRHKCFYISDTKFYFLRMY